MKERKWDQEVKAHGGNIAAFFDLDGTLTALPSLERRLFRVLRYRQAIPAKNYFLWLVEALRLAPRGFTAILEANKMYLREVNFRLHSGQLSVPIFFRDAIEKVAWHARQGHAIVLVSGTLEPLADEAARALEAELASRGIAGAVRVCATRLEETGSSWTGRIADDAMFGKAKARAARQIAAEMKIDLARCYAYGDSANDRWLLATVGQPAAVNPSKKLQRIAVMRGWPMIYWHEGKTLTLRTRRTMSSQGEERTREEAANEKQNARKMNPLSMREAGSRTLR